MDWTQPTFLIPTLSYCKKEKLLGYPWKFVYLPEWPWKFEIVCQSANSWNLASKWHPNGKIWCAIKCFGFKIKFWSLQSQIWVLWD